MHQCTVFLSTIRFIFAEKQLLDRKSVCNFITLEFPFIHRSILLPFIVLKHPSCALVVLRRLLNIRHYAQFLFYAPFMGAYFIASLTPFRQSPTNYDKKRWVCCVSFSPICMKNWKFCRCFCAIWFDAFTWFVFISRRAQIKLIYSAASHSCRITLRVLLFSHLILKIIVPSIL